MTEYRRQQANNLETAARQLEHVYKTLSRLPDAAEESNLHSLHETYQKSGPEDVHVPKRRRKRVLMTEVVEVAE